MLQDRHLRENLKTLVGPSNPQPRPLIDGQPRDLTTVERNTSRIGLKLPRHQREDGGLSCSIRPNQTEAFTLGDLKRHIIDGDQASEALDQTINAQA